MDDVEPRPRPALSPAARQQRNRDEMSAAILESARAIMREDGVGALNLNELARRIGMTTPALYGYFAGKPAIYDALFQQGLKMFLEGDEGAWRSGVAGWERLRAWFEVRIDLAMTHPELYTLVFSAPIPGFLPSEENIDISRRVLAMATRAVTEMIEAGEIAPGPPTRRSVDLLLAIRHGIIAERLGKASIVPAGSGRFDHLVEDAIAMLRAAWSPRRKSGTPAREHPGVLETEGG